ncbi:putative blue pigment (indigoidine) exporter [Curtobacterium sp. 320]|uniref:EamA family transporter n=1 Tax=Curtobacterium sp. 320 TaxID=2817749 RepID=UPI002859174A|nr:EamA family transporter [Curtobacterium sp. 320]MDR6571396.1 putative blue pigment (indigoidine) exporter [Curtobacterium sp. 320]
MLSNRIAVVTTTALAPVVWGTTYSVSTTFLPDGHPLLTATLRALPAGLILLAICRRLPRGAWWWRSLVLGALNIGAFFAFLFVAADRLPGGVAAVIGGVQPLLVALLASRFLAERLTPVTIIAGSGGLVGVALVALRAEAALDPVGVAAALLGAGSMAVGVVLTKRWASTESPVVTTSWQLLAGGLLLAALTLTTEPLPTSGVTLGAVAGYAWLAIVGTAFAYLVWFRGLAVLPTRVPAFLGLLSPIVALAIGTLVAGETLSSAQVVGIGVVLAAVGTAVTMGGRPGRDRDRSATGVPDTVVHN